jgi:hypothetical protein
MIASVERVRSGSIAPLLAYANTLSGPPKTQKMRSAPPVYSSNIFAIIQGRDEEYFNPFKVLLRNSAYIQYQEADDVKPNILAGLYLQFPNAAIKRLALSIVSATDTHDVKVAKITRWVIENIKYVEDKVNYGTEELWAAPTMTLAKKSGDCEDGAFLIHSLALNAGVPADRLRTYGGLVKAGAGAATGGHGWTAYRRESDNEWVVLDFSYYPSKAATGYRTLMKRDSNYIDDFFYMTLTEYVTTQYSNRVRDPDAYDSIGRARQQLWIGSLIDRLI